MTQATRTRPRRLREYTPTGKIGTLLSRAGVLQHQIKQLQAELDAMRPVLLDHLNKINLDRIEFGDIAVLRKVRHDWTYTPATAREQLALRQLQHFEQQQGLAIDSPKTYISIESIPAPQGP